MDRPSRVLLLALSCVPACFSPENTQNPATEAETDTPSPTSTGDAPDATSSSGEDPTNTTDVASTGASTVDPSGASTSSDQTTDGTADGTSSTTGGEEGSSTGAEPACGDGIAQPGEFCVDAVSTIEVTHPPERLLAGDLDGNARIDLVYAAIDATRLGILLGDGAGDFAEGPSESLNPFIPALGHFNDDDDLDIAFLDTTIALHVVLGDGNGTLPGTSSGVAVIGNVAVATGDLDNDGYDDLLSVGSGSSVGVARSNAGGSGVLTPSTVTDLGGSGIRNAAVITDLDGNDNLDFAFTDILGGGRVVACRGNGSGGASSCSGFEVGSLPVGLAAGDIDADGSTDLVAANSTSSSVTILLGQGNGAFEDGVEVPAGSNPQRVALADLDLDGFDDVIVTDGTDATVRIYRYDPDAEALGRPLVFDLEAGTPSDVVTGDFNDDGALDVAVGNTTAAAVTLLLSDA